MVCQREQEVVVHMVVPRVPIQVLPARIPVVLPPTHVGLLHTHVGVPHIRVPVPDLVYATSFLSYHCIGCQCTSTS